MIKKKSDDRAPRAHSRHREARVSGDPWGALRSVCSLFPYLTWKLLWITAPFSPPTPLLLLFLPTISPCPGRSAPLWVIQGMEDTFWMRTLVESQVNTATTSGAPLTNWRLSSCPSTQSSAGGSSLKVTALRPGPEILPAWTNFSHGQMCSTTFLSPGTILYYPLANGGGKLCCFSNAEFHQVLCSAFLAVGGHLGGFSSTLNDV